MSKKELGAALDDIMSSPSPTVPMGRKEAEKERLRRLPKTTTTVSFRVPKGERARLERVFARPASPWLRPCAALCMNTPASSKKIRGNLRAADTSLLLYRLKASETNLVTGCGTR